METNKIQELVFSFLSTINAKPESTADGIWQASIPESEQIFFNGYEKYSFTFDRSLAEKHRELELICEGSYLFKKIIERLSSIPKVSRLYGTAAPELAPHEAGKVGELMVLTPGKAHYRQKVLFTFKVSFLCDHRRDKLFSALADPANNDIYLKEGIQEVDVTKYQETPDPSIVLEESGEDMLRLYLQACKKLESDLVVQVKEMKEQFQSDYQVELKKIEAYLSEQKRELQQKKENVCFHLYFFQKEEEIEKMIRDLDAEQARKMEELKEKYRLKVEINLLNAVVLCTPTLGIPASSLTKKKREGQGIPLALGNKEEYSALSLV